MLVLALFPLPELVGPALFTLGDNPLPLGSPIKTHFFHLNPRASCLHKKVITFFRVGIMSFLESCFLFIFFLVESFKKLFVELIYFWHFLHAFSSGVNPSPSHGSPYCVLSQQLCVSDPVPSAVCLVFVSVFPCSARCEAHLLESEASAKCVLLVALPVLYFPFNILPPAFRVFAFRG